MELALASDPNIFIAERQVRIAEGSSMIASGNFDTTLTANADADDSMSPTSENTASDSRSFSQSVSANRLLRSGQTIEPRINLRQDDGDPSISTGTFAFIVRQPLLRGRTPSAVTAEERASNRDLRAAELDLNHRVAERLLAVISQYWSVRAAWLDLEILRETEARAQQFLASTQRLVAADLTPAADLIQLEADLISRQAARLAGEQTLFQARQDLRAEIGLEAEELADLGLPSEAFPDVSPTSLPPNARALLAEALTARADLEASRQRLEAAHIRLDAARDAIKPRLDLLFTPSYTGLIEDDAIGDAFAALASNIPGASANISLSFLFPIENRVARGLVQRSEASTEQQELAVELRRIQIGADVPSALDAVRISAERLLLLERAVTLFEKTLENEQKKLRAGSSILIDVLNQRDRLTNAERGLVAARQAVAQAVIGLRFETGTLVRPAGGGVQTVRLEDLTTVPLGTGPLGDE